MNAHYAATLARLFAEATTLKAAKEAAAALGVTIRRAPDFTFGTPAHERGYEVFPKGDSSLAKVAETLPEALLIAEAFALWAQGSVYGDFHGPRPEHFARALLRRALALHGLQAADAQVIATGAGPSLALDIRAGFAMGERYPAVRAIETTGRFPLAQVAEELAQELADKVARYAHEAGPEELAALPAEQVPGGPILARLGVARDGLFCIARPRLARALSADTAPEELARLAALFDKLAAGYALAVARHAGRGPRAHCQELARDCGELAAMARGRIASPQWQAPARLLAPEGKAEERPAFEALRGTGQAQVALTLEKRPSGAVALLAPGGAWVGPGPTFPDSAAARAWAACNGYTIAAVIAVAFAFPLIVRPAPAPMLPLSAGAARVALALARGHEVEELAAIALERQGKRYARALSMPGPGPRGVA